MTADRDTVSTQFSVSKTTNIAQEPPTAIHDNDQDIVRGMEIHTYCDFGKIYSTECFIVEYICMGAGM